MTQVQIDTKLKKWGNSFAVIIPMDVVQREMLKEEENISLLLLKDSREAFRKTFGMGKGKLKKTAQQVKDELRRELYN